LVAVTQWIPLPPLFADPTGFAGTQVLALAQDDVPAGYHADLDDFYRELDQGSAPLTILRD